MSKSKSKKVSAEQTEALAELREIFSDVEAGRAGFFINCTGVTRGNTASNFQLYVVRDNVPHNITYTVAQACEYKLTKQGEIRIGGWGTDRYLVLMYYGVGFALFPDDSSKALDFGNKYYRHTI